MSDLTRRSFGQLSIGALLTTSLLQMLFERDAFAEAVKPITEQWLRDVNALCQDVKSKQIKQVDWQGKLEALFARVDLPEICKLIDYDKLTADGLFRPKGERSIPFNFPKVEGVGELAFGKQVFALQKGHSIVPHGHNNMSTAFLILDGSFHGRHYDRLEDSKTHMVIKPTIDRTFGQAEFSTISDDKDNVHWFEALSDKAYILNIHVLIATGSGKQTGRVYIDPDGEKLAGGLIRAPLISAKTAVEKYG
ncbi:MAG: hypothetical protein GC162_00185 [Planctomycetes bacterium]|nr:hypothetical protein [Planctomycetota bacterium]